MKYTKKYVYVYTLFLSKCPNNGYKLKMVKVVSESWFEFKNIRYTTKMSGIQQKTSGIQQNTSSIQEITIT